MSKLEHDTIAAEYREKINSYEKPWFKSCSALLEKVGFRELKCLDLCSGNGEYSEILRDRFGMQVTCADYVPSHLDQARKKGFSTISIDLDSEESAVKELAEEYKEKFDLVVSLATIEHVFNSDNLLQFSHNVLKPGGKLIINTPNISFIGFRLFSLFGGNRPFGEGHHVRFWDYRFLRTNLFFNGFVVEYDHRGFFTLPEDVISRALRGRLFLAKMLALLFLPCKIFQRLPYLRGLCCDELTILAIKDDSIPLGFDYLKTKMILENKSGEESRSRMIERLLETYERGWLKEHLNMSKLAEECISKEQDN